MLCVRISTFNLLLSFKKTMHHREAWGVTVQPSLALVSFCVLTRVEAGKVYKFCYHRSGQLRQYCMAMIISQVGPYS